jgi:hypothetical protein
MPLPFTISDLRQRPRVFDIVADRIWRVRPPAGPMTGSASEPESRAVAGFRVHETRVPE